MKNHEQFEAALLALMDKYDVGHAVIAYPVECDLFVKAMASSIGGGLYATEMSIVVDEALVAHRDEINTKVKAKLEELKRGRANE